MAGYHKKKILLEVRSDIIRIDIIRSCIWHITILHKRVMHQNANSKPKIADEIL